ncbi:MAG: SET domain-containing protein-lysine N-methyltransferase [Candidatus Omnitrophica bacterium]|nr:SET domain-containing protein-lysine N-methyltransferase [Candidatus Omnitrophota bacterium]
MRATTSPYVLKRESSIHNFGIFAKKDIPKDTKIIEYVGEKITKAESNRRGEECLSHSKINKEHGSVYIFELNKRYDLDGNVRYNTAKYINHSCHPNCEAHLIHGHIWIVAAKNIKKGTELSYNYGYGFEDYHEHECKCGAHNCVGYILDKDHWHKLKKVQLLEGHENIAKTKPSANRKTTRKKA